MKKSKIPLLALIIMAITIFVLAACSTTRAPVPQNYLGETESTSESLNVGDGDPIETSSNNTEQTNDPDEAGGDYGIIALTTYGSTNDLVSRVGIVSIDPFTGAMNNIREFETYGFFICNSPAGNFVNNAKREPFFSRVLSERMDKIAVTMINVGNENAHHVGWVENRGGFVDVSALVVKHQGDFAEVIMHGNGKFGPNNFFYFSSEQPGTRLRQSSSEAIYDIFRVPQDDLRPESVEKVLTNVGTNVIDRYYIHLDGSVSFEHPTFVESKINGEIVVPNYTGAYTLRQWLDENTMLAVKSDNGRWLVFLDGASIDEWNELIHGSGIGVSRVRETLRYVLPNIATRHSWDGVISPDGSEIAFLSRTAGHGTLGEVELFISTIDGEEIRRVDTDRTLEDFHILSWGIEYMN